jgi:hypothetical protein
MTPNLGFAVKTGRRMVLYREFSGALVFPRDKNEHGCSIITRISQRQIVP